jgi:DHA2 family multidrug resistance protein
VGIGSLQVMLDQGKELDWFNSREIIILTIVAVVSISFLVVWELTDENPIVDLSLFKSRNFTIGCLCISLAYMLYFGAIVLLPQLLQEVYGYTATWAGLASAPVGVIPVCYRRSLVVLPISSICAGWSHSALLCTPSASTGAHIRLSREWILALPHGRNLFRASPWPASLCR